MANYEQHVGINKNTPQTQQADPRQIKNEAGGFVFEATEWTKLNRFLILGNEGGSYYANERKMTIDNYDALKACMKLNGPKTVQAIIDVSKSGRAVKNDPAIFALAVCLKEGDLETKRMAVAATNLICRTGTHIFQLAQYVEAFGGWGALTKRAFKNWYRKKDMNKLAYQVIKYQNRNGWSHKDILAKCHLKTYPEGNVKYPGASESYDPLYNWVVNGWESVGNDPHSEEGLRQIWAFEKAKGADVKETIQLIKDYRLPKECIRTELKSDPVIQMALLKDMPIWATVRDLANYTRSGLLTNTSAATKLVVEKLSNKEAILKSRIHPMQILIGLKTYASGQGMRNTWSPVPKIIDALDEAFYMAFDNVEPTGKNILVAIDSSGSMSGARAFGSPLSVLEAAAAMALIYAHIEPNVEFVSFDTSTKTSATFSKRSRLDHVLSKFRCPGGGTDCASPIKWMNNRQETYDAVIMFTDCQTWAGGGWYGGSSGHVHEALRQYRKSKNPNLKFIAAALQSNKLSLSMPEDNLSFECAGVDANLPILINGFIKGEF